MPIIFTRSAKSIALEKLLYFVVCIIVGGAFAAVLFMVDQAGFVVKLASGVAILIALAIGLTMVREMIAVLKNGQDWHVEITEDTLSWHSPIPKQMTSFEVALSDISSAVSTLIRYKNSKRTPKTEYRLEFVDGKSIKLDPQRSGINPAKVFAALATKGINVQALNKLQGNKVKIGV